MASPTTTLVFAERSDQLRKGRNDSEGQTPETTSNIQRLGDLGKDILQPVHKMRSLQPGNGRNDDREQRWVGFGDDDVIWRASRHKRQPAAR